MKTLGISDFKVRCIQVLKEAHRDREPLVVTRRGVPLVRIEPIPPSPEERRLGALEGQTMIHGNLVGADFPDDWEMEA